jgi:hypothetical protein
VMHHRARLRARLQALWKPCALSSWVPLGAIFNLAPVPRELEIRSVENENGLA